MRRRFALTVLATTSIVVAAFLIPLVVLVREIAVDRAMAEGTADARNVAALIGVLRDPESVRLVVAGYDRDLITTTVRLPDGTVVGPPLPSSAGLAAALEGRAVTTTVGADQEIVVPVETPAGRAVVRTVVPGEALRRGVTQAYVVLGALAVGLLVVAFVVADRFAKWVLRPVGALATVARHLGQGDLGARVGPVGPAELVEVGTALNLLADRIGGLVARERESVADLSHRLRTPLTALRLEAHGLADPGESARMVALVRTLERTATQIIAEARRPADGAAPPRCDAAAVVADRVRFWAPLAEDLGRRMELRLAAGPLPVAAAGTALAAAVDALLENVLAHTPDGTPFAVTLLPRPAGGACLRVADAGPGLSGPEVLARGASAAGSTGLGLDIVRRVAESSGGGVRLTRSATGGAVIEVELGPAAR